MLETLCIGSTIVAVVRSWTTRTLDRTWTGLWSSPIAVRSNAVQVQSGSGFSIWRGFVDRMDQSGLRSGPWTGIYLKSPILLCNGSFFAPNLGYSYRKFLYLMYWPEMCMSMRASWSIFLTLWLTASTYFCDWLCGTSNWHAMVLGTY